jgi:hypothetical protein
VNVPVGSIMQSTRNPAWIDKAGFLELTIWTMGVLPLCGMGVGLALSRTSRRTFAAQKQAAMLLEVRVEQLVQEKERLDYERRLAHHRRCAAASSGGRRSGKGKRTRACTATDQGAASASYDADGLVCGGRLTGQRLPDVVATTGLLRAEVSDSEGLVRGGRLFASPVGFNGREPAAAAAKVTPSGSENSAPKCSPDGTTHPTVLHPKGV